MYLYTYVFSKKTITLHLAAVMKAIIVKGVNEKEDNPIRTRKLSSLVPLFSRYSNEDIESWF